ncbi:Endonuclease/exonuclease/phosphatase [Lactarius quietus]|nr:Endonuclease/exonuclease/phosphatase [Lactarius quietus]
MTGIEKWSAIYQSMKENKLVIMAVQETHLDDDLIHSITFVINKALIATRELEKVELISGCAPAIKFKWHKENDITLVNVYMPNDRGEHHTFWELVDTRMRAKGLRHPDMLLGDFNLTEDAIDRAPAHLDDITAIAALRNLRQCFRVKDSWRHMYLDERAFTYLATSHCQKIMSRLDRIYVADTVENAISSWKIKQTVVPSDHWLVAVNFIPNQAPYIGKG